MGEVRARLDLSNHPRNASRLGAREGAAMLSRRRFLVLAGASVPVAVAAVAGFTLLPSDEEKSEFPELKLGQQSCAHCGMIISDARFAAAWRDGDGDDTFFDDIGCMVAMGAEHPPAGFARYYVHDYLAGEADGWIDAELAYYAKDDSIRTPMASGIAAFERREDAEAVTGEVASWGELAALSERSM